MSDLAWQRAEEKRQMRAMRTRACRWFAILGLFMVSLEPFQNYFVNPWAFSSLLGVVGVIVVLWLALSCLLSYWPQGGIIELVIPGIVLGLFISPPPQAKEVWLWSSDLGWLVLLVVTLITISVSLYLYNQERERINATKLLSRRERRTI